MGKLEGKTHQLWILARLWAAHIKSMCRDMRSFEVNKLGTQGVSIIQE